MAKSKKRNKSRAVKKKTKKESKKAKQRIKKSHLKTKEPKFEIGFEEVTFRCSCCGREFRMVKSSGFSTEGMLCQRCAAGGGRGFDEDNDF